MSSSQPDYSRKWWIMLSVAMGTFLCTIDGSIVNIALPTLDDKLHTHFSTVQWVVVSYLLVITSLMLGVARLGDMFGKKRLYQPGMVLFTSASVLCGLAPSIGFLIAFRAIQGIGAALIMALGMAIVTESFPPTERGRALGISGTVVSLGISLGPTLGGLLLGTVGWRAIFLVNLPVGILGVYLVGRFVPDTRPPGGQRFDFAGALIMLATLTAFALALTFGPTTGWSDPKIIGLFAAAVIGLILFMTIEQRLDQPMIDLSLFHDVLFSISLLTGFMVFIIIAGLFVLPFYLEQVKGLSTMQIGLYLTVFPAALGLTAPVAGSLSDRYGSRGIAVIGLIVVAVGCWGVSNLDASTSTIGYILRVLPLGFGAGLFQSPNNSAIMGSAPRERLGVASGLMAISRTLGQMTGIAVIGAVFSSRVIAAASLKAGTDVVDAPHWAIVEGVQAAYLVAAALIGVSVVLSVVAFRLERRRKANRVVLAEQQPYKNMTDMSHP